MRLPTLAATLTAEDTLWRRLTVLGWYGAGERVIEIASGTAVWRHGGMPVVPIRWVLVRDPAKRFEPQALLCSDLAREPAQVVSWFVRRWSVEVTFQEVRAHLGSSPGVSVRTQRSPAPRPACSSCSQSSICRLHGSRPVSGGRSPRPHGTPSHAPPSPMPWPRSAARSGARGFSDITTPTPSDKTPLPPASALGLRALPRRMNGQSRAKPLAATAGRAEALVRDAVRRPGGAGFHEQGDAHLIALPAGQDRHRLL